MLKRDFYYILDENHNIIATHDMMEWTQWFKEGNIRVELTKLFDCSISTVFLSIDHSFGGDIPILFETMIFGGPLNDYQDRYATWEEAVIGHNEAVQLAKKNLLKRVFRFLKMKMERRNEA